jgi:hypothetical protein
VQGSIGQSTHCLHTANAIGEQEKATARLEEVHALTMRHAAAARKQRDSSAAVNGVDAAGDAVDLPRAPEGEAAEGNGADIGPPRWLLDADWLVRQPLQVSLTGHCYEQQLVTSQ